jgi:hypothetical protein
VGIPTDTNTTTDTATGNGVFCDVSAVSYKQDSWGNELVVEESRTGKNISTEAEDFVGIRHHATTGEDIAD